MTLPATGLLDFLDPQRLRRLCDHLFEAFGIATSIITIDGTLVVGPASNSICNLFYHRHPKARRLCANFDQQIIGQLAKYKVPRVFKCRHGLIEAAIPLLVNSEVAGILFSGQFFFNPPATNQIENFIKQAEQYGFDQNAFTAAVKSLPVIPPARSQAMVDFLGRLAELIVDLAHANSLNLQRGAELEGKAYDLEELSKALETIIENRAVEKKAIEAGLMTNVRKFILPYLDQLEMCSLDQDGKVLVNIIRSNIDNLLSPLASTLASCYRRLTPAECRVADLVRQGMGTKQIAKSLYLSPHTITNIRNSIRKKLGLTGKKQSLKTFLNSI